MEQLGTCELSATVYYPDPHPRTPKCVNWKPVPEPAEYTCPRCESNVSTHVCMGETVAGETNVTCQHCQAKFFAEPGSQPKCPKCKRTLVLFSAPAVAAPAEGKPRVFVDMDGVVVDFDSFKNKRGLTGDEVKKLPGAYLEMEPFPEALLGIKALVGSGYDVWLATKPPTGIAYAYSDKAAWVFKHLPELRRKLILTHDKGLLGCARDFLIDDRPHKANCEQFPGTLIRFTNGETWAGVVSKIRNGASTPPTADPAQGPIEDLVWKILNAPDQDDVRGYLMEAATWGVSLGRAEGLEEAAKEIKRLTGSDASSRAIRALKEKAI